MVRLQDNFFRARVLMFRPIDQELRRLNPGIKELLIVLDIAPGAREIDIFPAKRRKGGVATFTVCHDWLSTDCTNDRTGAWQAASHLAQIVISLHQSGDMVLPSLEHIRI